MLAYVSRFIVFTEALSVPIHALLKPSLVVSCILRSLLVKKFFVCIRMKSDGKCDSYSHQEV